MRTTRRAFLTATGLGLPAAAVLALTRPCQGDGTTRSLAQEVLRERPTDPPATPPPGYSYRPTNVRGGIVKSVSYNELIIANNIDGDIRLVLPPEVRQDEASWVLNLPVELGDDVTARGALQPDGSFLVDDYWVNAKFYLGHILEMLDPGPELPIRFRIRDRYDLTPWHPQEPDGHIVLVDPRTLVFGPYEPPQDNAAGYRIPQASAGERNLMLEVGQYVEVTGREYHGELIAISMMLQAL